MKKIIIATLATLGFMGQSLAADLPARMPVKAAPMMAPAYNWNGFYLGANVGYGWSKSNNDAFDIAGVFVDNTTGTGAGIFGGGQIGYNWQFAPNWLLGIEADAQASDIKGSNLFCSAAGCALGYGKIDDFGTVRGRFGYVANNLLLYGTGGWAWSHGTADRTITVAPNAPALVGLVANSSGTHSGWTAGAGIEWGFLPNWTVKVEYLHLQFDNVTRNFSYAGFPGAFRHIDANVSVDTVRVGMNYLFNAGPVVARY